MIIINKTKTKYLVNKLYNTHYNDNIFLSLGVVVLLFIKLVFFYNPTGPVIFRDELLYKNNAMLLFQGAFYESAHYPPFYSLLLSISFFFTDWYNKMILLNYIYSSLLLIPVWCLLKKYLNTNLARGALLLVALIPFHVVYPAYIMSENIFLFLFALAVFLSTKGIQSGICISFLYGFTLVACYLTKYLMLPAIPILVLYWMLIPYLEGKYKDFNYLLLEWRNLIIMVFAFGLPLGLWLLFATYSGLSIESALGFGISGIRSADISIQSLTMWLSAYVSYIILMCAPFIVFLLYYLWNIKRSLKVIKIGVDDAFIFLVIILSAVYCLLAMQHSFGASYNYPDPLYLLGRYLMHLTPLIIVAGSILMVKYYNNVIGLKRISIVITSISILLIFAAIFVLYRQGLWNFPPWFADIVFNSPDTFFYRTQKQIVFIAASVIFVCGILVAIMPFKSQPIINKSLIALTLIIFWQGMIFNTAASRAAQNVSGLHARNIAELIQQDLLSIVEFPLYFDLSHVDECTMYHALLFWDVDLKLDSINKIIDVKDNELKYGHYYLSNEQSMGRLLYSYRVKEIEYYIYDYTEE